MCVWLIGMVIHLNMPMLLLVHHSYMHIIYFDYIFLLYNYFSTIYSQMLFSGYFSGENFREKFLVSLWKMFVVAVY